MRMPLPDPSRRLPPPHVVRLLVRRVSGTTTHHLHGPGLHLLLGASGRAHGNKANVPLPKDSLLLLPRSDELSLRASSDGLLLSIDLPEDHAFGAFDAPFLLLPLSSHPSGTWAAALAPALGGPEAVADTAAREVIAGAVTRIAELAEHGLARLEGIAAVRTRTRAWRLSRVEAARAYMQQRLDRRVILAEVARAAGLSEFHLHRAFVDVWGIGPGAFHTRARLDWAEQLMRSGHRATQVARLVGYSTHASFHRAFVRQFGYAPGHRGGPKKDPA